MSGENSWGGWWLLLSVITIVLDQWTKHLASTGLPVHESVPVLPYLNFTLTSNPGGAFSFLSTQGGWQRWLFVAVSTLVSCVLVVWLLKLRRGQALLALALSLVLGGAVGNLWDRVVLGEVTDYVDAYYIKEFHGEHIAGVPSDGSLLDGYLYRGNVYHDGSYHYDVYYRGWHWPAFNVADSAIFIGAILLLMFSFRPQPPRT